MEIEIIDILKILALIGAGGFGAYYSIFRRKLSAIRGFIDAVDDALYDDKVTEEEFRKIWAKGRDILT